MKEDMKLIFDNSLKYNTSRKSPIVSMTKRLKEFFLEELQVIRFNGEGDCGNKRNLQRLC